MANKTLKPVVAAIGAAFVGTVAMSSAQAATNPFGLTEIGSGYLQTAGNHGGQGSCGQGRCGGDKNKEGRCGGSKGDKDKCGEGKCGEGKCGEGKCGGDKGDEGKCGEGKCGGDKHEKSSA